MANNKHFIVLVLKLSLPIAAQQMLSAGLNLVDTLMVSRLGDIQISSASIANQIFFFLLMAMIGVCSGSSVLISRYYGGGNLDKLAAIHSLCLCIGIFLGLTIGVPSFFLSDRIIAIFTSDQSVILQGGIFLKIIALSFIFYPISVSYTSCLNSMRKPLIPLVVSATSIALNALLNYCLIFGEFGFPEMGLVGAAYGTLASRIVESGLMVLCVHLSQNGKAMNPIKLKELTKKDVGAFMVVSMPVICNELLYAAGVSVYKYVYAQLGTSYLAAISVIQVIEKFSFVLLAGIGSACAILIGNALGKELRPEAEKISRQFLKLIITCSFLVGIILFVFREQIIGYFGMQGESRFTAINILAIFSVVCVFRSISMLFNIGILRGGGDTKVALYIDLGGIWLIGVPLALISGLVLELGIYMVYILISLDVVSQALVSLWYYSKRKWIKNIS